MDEKELAKKWFEIGYGYNSWPDEVDEWFEKEWKEERETEQKRTCWCGSTNFEKYSNKYMCNHCGNVYDKDPREEEGKE